MPDSKLIWEGRPSQIINFFPFLKTIVSIALVLYCAPIAKQYIPAEFIKYLSTKNILIVCGIMLLYPLWKYMTVKYHKYTVNSDAIFITTGVLSSQCDPCDMYKVKDETVHKPIYLRIFGLGNIELITSDHSTPLLRIRAIKKSDWLLGLIRAAKIKARKEHGVREFD
ncbi:PH domain-containing protein [Aliikangiella maris]|uniref:PH domain-containing protein n=2 Tax=Aliikangiella maris TaxID=3162458 RepID=A0ABV3MTU5_9GAMM